MSDLIITPAHTANPNARKFTIKRPDETILLNHGNPAGTAGHRPAGTLLGLPGVRNLCLTGNYITVNVEAGRTWTGIGRGHSSLDPL